MHSGRIVFGAARIERMSCVLPAITILRDFRDGAINGWIRRGSGGQRNADEITSRGISRVRASRAPSSRIWLATATSTHLNLHFAPERNHTLNNQEEFLDCRYRSQRDSHYSSPRSFAIMSDLKIQ